MLYSEIIAVCSEIHTKHINTLCGQNVELLIVKRAGTYSNHRFLKGQFCVEFIISYHETVDEVQTCGDALSPQAQTY
jgi:hypothetical protein